MTAKNDSGLEPADTTGDTVADRLSAAELEELRGLLEELRKEPAPEQEQEEPAGSARLVLASGRTVAAENTNSTHHCDPVTGETVPVLSTYTV